MKNVLLCQMSLLMIRFPWNEQRGIQVTTSDLGKIPCIGLIFEEWKKLNQCSTFYIKNFRSCMNYLSLFVWVTCSAFSMSYLSRLQHPHLTTSSTAHFTFEPFCNIDLVFSISCCPATADKGVLFYGNYPHATQFHVGTNNSHAFNQFNS